jgi:hypothetical protein
MKIYVCYGTWVKDPVLSRIVGQEHVCGAAHKSLVDAGYKPEVVKAYGLGPLPDWMNFTKGRREVRAITGNNWVPLLVTDDGEHIQGSQRIIDWAAAHPA